ncbi:hypothetical protein [Oceanispirochaeta sp.]|jgi:AcrR family transcriptional regulator|uniref:hypothetical protein n=1 Tax=Oceanispirochaeta sp. TaxID=2035350 RepID=UPI002635A3D7|nr:hypothetical protein [Oceanispirochaeta sp.]MDA3956881.1 hypothetical protein [Oceanispirochaeta sp.]
METIKTIAKKANISTAAVYHRIKKIGMKRRYEENENGRAERVFDKEDAELILNYQPEKPGRKS